MTAQINIYDETGPYCVEESTATKIYSKLLKALSNNEDITVSFHNINVITTHWLHVAFGQLYKTFDSENLARHLTLRDICPADRSLFYKCMKCAKEVHNE